MIHEEKTTRDRLKSKKIEMDRLWDPEDVWAYLGISRTSFYRLMAREKIPSLTIGCKKKFIPEQILAWAKKKTAA